MARKGQAVDLKPKELVIDEIELLSCELPEIKIRVVCSKGTYIRSIARDLGEKLGSGAYLTALCRTRSGDFTLEDAYTLPQVQGLLFPDPDGTEDVRR